MIFILLGFTILLYGLFNFKQAFLYFIVFKVFLVTNISLLSLPGIPFVSMDLFMNIVFLFLYYFNSSKFALDTSEFPYKKPFVFVVISWFISCIFAAVGFTGAFTMFITQGLSQFVVPWLCWRIFTSENDFKQLLRLLSIAFIVTGLYGLYEYTIQANPLADYLSTLIQDQERMVLFESDADAVRGYRISSVFAHTIGGAMNWAIFALLGFLSIVKLRLKSLSRHIVLAAALLSIVCLLLAQSRSAYLFLFVGCLSFVDLKNKRFWALASFLLVIIISAMPFLEQFSDSIVSMFDSSVNDKVGGSSIEQRLDQLTAVLAITSMSPICGHGFKFLGTMNSIYADSVLGLESVWFTTITQFGIIGVIAYLFFAYYSIIVIPKKYKSKELFFLSLAYWLAISITTTPGMLTYLYYFVLIYVIKYKRGGYM